jgi:spermidine synthase
MKPFIYPEMMVHVPLCTHKDPKNVLLITDNGSELETELGRYRDSEVKTVSANAVLETIRDEADNSYDVVLCEADSDAALLAHISRVSKEDALIAMTHPDLDDVDANKQVMEVLGNYFKIIMPYNAGDKTLLLASKEYHPTADLILQRTDLLEGQQFYNCDIHPAAFAMPNYVRKNYLGVIRN